MAKTLVRAGTACEIVGLDRVKFNDAVASGAYPCAPSTLKGSARLFDEEALLPLYFFARLTEFGIPASRAGKLACEAATTAHGREAEASDRIILLRSEIMETFVCSRQKLPDGSFKEYDPHHEEHGSHYGLGRVVFAVEFYVSHVRELISERLERERNIIGED